VKVWDRSATVENQLKAMMIQVPLLGLLAVCAASSAKETDDIPAPLRVSASEVLTRQAHAVGVQIYQCSAHKDDAARFEWLLKGPEADLFDTAGNKIGRHYAGPTWEAKDGSKVWGEVVARTNGLEPNAVAWLLLSAKSSGNGVFSGVRFIQRLHTAGGTAPADGCNQGAVGREVRVSYTADYWFYSAKP
jgi:hypothetical protein